MAQSSDSYIPALRYRSLTRFYDSIVQLTTREGRFKQALLKQACFQDRYRVLDLGCGTGTLALMGKRAYPSATPGAPGTYEYYASAGGDLAHSDHGRPFGEDSQLAGALIVDPRGGSPADRVFVITLWRSGTDFGPTPAHQVAVINGKSWPYTERLTYAADKPVRWRWINASDTPHPMHMHGSYFRVDSTGDGETDHVFPSGQQPMVATYRMMWGGTMSTYWIPPPGHWLFHCHFISHMSGEMTVANALTDKFVSEQHGNHMAGMVLGITVPGDRKPVPAHGRIRKIRLLVCERPARDDFPAGFGYQVQEGQGLIPENVAQSGPPLILSPQTDDPEFVSSPRHEFNFWFEPEGAKSVLEAPWKKIVCTPPTGCCIALPSPHKRTDPLDDSDFLARSLSAAADRKMTVYPIGYDLNKPDQDYSDLFEAIKSHARSSVLQQRPYTFAQTKLSSSPFACDKAVDHTLWTVAEDSAGKVPGLYCPNRLRRIVVRCVKVCRSWRDVRVSSGCRH